MGKNRYTHTHTHYSVKQFFQEFQNIFSFIFLKIQESLSMSPRKATYYCQTHFLLTFMWAHVRALQF